MMLTIYVYHDETRAIERCYRQGSSPMPYSGGALSVDEFRGNSKSRTLWTDKRAMEAWKAFREGWGKPISVGHAFKRIWEGGHGLQSQHYAGTAFDIAQKCSREEQAQLRNYAMQSGLWSYVEPVKISPQWVHADWRSDAAGVGYPAIYRGSRGVHVFVLQDALGALGISGAGLDGMFGAGTQSALIRFQRLRHLAPNGVAGSDTWASLFERSRGIGHRPSVID